MKTTTKSDSRKLSRAIAKERALCASRVAELEAKLEHDTAAFAAAESRESAAVQAVEADPTPANKGRLTLAKKAAWRLSCEVKYCGERLKNAREAHATAAQRITARAAAAWFLAAAPSGSAPLVHGSGVGQSWAVMPALMPNGRVAYFDSAAGRLLEMDVAFPSCLKRGVEIMPATTYSPEGGDTCTPLAVAWKTMSVNAAPLSILTPPTASVVRSSAGWPTCYGESHDYRVQPGDEIAPIKTVLFGSVEKTVVDHILAKIRTRFPWIQCAARWAYYADIRDISLTYARSAENERSVACIRQYLVEHARLTTAAQMAASLAAQMEKQAQDLTIPWTPTPKPAGPDTRRLLRDMRNASPVIRPRVALDGLQQIIAQ